MSIVNFFANTILLPIVMFNAQPITGTIEPLPELPPAVVSANISEDGSLVVYRGTDRIVGCLYGHGCGYWPVDVDQQTLYEDTTGTVCGSVGDEPDPLYHEICDGHMEQAATIYEDRITVAYRGLIARWQSGLIDEFFGTHSGTITIYNDGTTAEAITINNYLHVLYWTSGSLHCRMQLVSETGSAPTIDRDGNYTLDEYTGNACDAG